jgi:TnpA family transposase
LSYLLGYSFMPRLRDLADQQLYRLDRDARYGCLDALFRATVDTGLIREQWDQLVRVAASLRHRTAPANVIVQRLANSAPSDRLAKALTALGRAVKTIYILRYLNDPELRHCVQLQLIITAANTATISPRAVYFSPIEESSARAMSMKS